MAGALRDLRGVDPRPFDLAVALPADIDPAPYAAAGATWWLAEFGPGTAVDTVRGVIRDGPWSR